MLHLNGYNSFSVLWISYPVTRDVSILEEVVNKGEARDISYDLVFPLTIDEDVIIKKKTIISC